MLRSDHFSVRLHGVTEILHHSTIFGLTSLVRLIRELEINNNKETMSQCKINYIKVVRI